MLPTNSDAACTVISGGTLTGPLVCQNSSAPATMATPSPGSANLQLLAKRGGITAGAPEEEEAGALLWRNLRRRFDIAGDQPGPPLADANEV